MEIGQGPNWGCSAEEKKWGRLLIFTGLLVVACQKMKLFVEIAVRTMFAYPL
jgi:hypothetical protein